MLQMHYLQIATADLFMYLFFNPGLQEMFKNYAFYVFSAKSVFQLSINKKGKKAFHWRGKTQDMKYAFVVPDKG